MKKEDLRIGNLVYDSVRNKEVQIQLKHFRELYISEKMFFERYKAIELTEEKLLSFGFDKDEYQAEEYGESIGNLYKLNNFLVCKKEDAFYNYIEIDGDNYYSFCSTELTFAHQLQNLYYSLKKEELPIA